MTKKIDYFQITYHYDNGRQPSDRPPRDVRGQPAGPVPGGRRRIHPHILGGYLLSKVNCQRRRVSFDTVDLMDLHKMFLINFGGHSENQ